MGPFMLVTVELIYKQNMYASSGGSEGSGGCAPVRISLFVCNQYNNN
jgi:hypothetical protein